MEQNRKGVSTKILVLLLAAVLLIGGVIGGSLAWLTTGATPVTNTFVVGDIDITLAETTGTSYTIVPGNDITKDPKVTVLAGSVDCWLFVKVTEANWPAFTETGTTTRKVDYALAAGWTELTGEAGVYYRQVSTAAANQDFPVLLNNKVTVSGNLTKTEVDSLTTQPTLTFAAYAVQRDTNVNSAAAAWAIATAP